MATHLAKVDRGLSMVKHDVQGLIDDANKRGDLAGVAAWSGCLSDLEAVHRRLATARQLQDWERNPPPIVPAPAYQDIFKAPEVEAVEHPNHYGGDTVYETIKVIKAWGLGFSLGNAVKYISRAGKKDPTKHLEDLRKAEFYLRDEIATVEKAKQ